MDKAKNMLPENIQNYGDVEQEFAELFVFPSSDSSHYARSFVYSPFNITRLLLSLRQLYLHSIEIVY